MIESYIFLIINDSRRSLIINELILTLRSFYESFKIIRQDIRKAYNESE
jgi:hypothetical protein